MVVNNPFIRYKIYSTPTPADPERFQPGPKNRILCLISKNNGADKPFLQKVLAAARIDDQQVAIVEVSDKDAILVSSQPWFDQIDYLMCFGVPVGRLGLQIPKQMYQCLKFREVGIMQFPALSSIKDDKVEKQKLWHVMKNEFLHE